MQISPNQLDNQVTSNLISTDLLLSPWNTDT
jgi:hypothetical protein